MGALQRVEWSSVIFFSFKNHEDCLYDIYRIQYDDIIFKYIYFIRLNCFIIALVGKYNRVSFSNRNSLLQQQDPWLSWYIILLLAVVGNSCMWNI